MGAKLDRTEKLAVLVAAGAVAYAVYKAATNDQDAGIEDLPVDVGPVTLTRPELVLMADGLEAALLGGWTGEDESAIELIMSRCMTDGDVLSLVREFGVRCEGVLIQRCGSLPQWFVIYLNESERGRINEILSANGITYRF